MTDNKPIEIKLDNKEVLTRLQELASRGENLRPLMKNIAEIMATATEDNFKDEGRPEKWIDLSETTKNNDKKSANTPDKFCKFQVNSHHPFQPLTMTIPPSSVQTLPTQQSTNSVDKQAETRKSQFLKDHILN